MRLAKSNQNLEAVLENSSNYHAVNKIGVTDEEAGRIHDVWECLTCRGIVEAGGIVLSETFGTMR